ncbi:MAG: alpha/beta hydrolase, partial [Bacteroidota bacterium]
MPNILYGQGKNIKNEREDLYLDLYLPHDDSISKRPVLVFMHGGGVVNGSRKTSVAQQVCKLFASKGYVTASISYRLGIEVGKSKNDYAEALYRAQQDGRSAIRFLKANAEEWGLDTSQFFIAGSSA